MSWRCAKCGERLEDTFDECWRCGTTRALTPDEEPQAEETEAAEEYAEAEMIREENAAVARLNDDLGRLLPRARSSDEQPDHLDGPGYGFHRLAKAYRLYRERQERTARPALPDLDRRWTQFFLACGGTAGYVLAMIFWVDVVARLPEDLFIAAPVVLAGLVVITGSRATRAELAAADPAKIRAGVT